MRDGIVSYLLLMLARRSPMLLLALVGSVVAVIRWKLHPRVSLMTLIALVIYVIEAVLFSILLYYMLDLMQVMRLSGKAVDWVYTIVFFFEDFIPALVILLLVGAAFSQRNQAFATSNG